MISSGGVGYIHLHRVPTSKLLPAFPSSLPKGFVLCRSELGAGGRGMLDVRGEGRRGAASSLVDRAGWRAPGEALGDGAFWLWSLPRQDLSAAVGRRDLRPPGLAMSWQWEQPASARECAAARWFPKISFGLRCFPPLLLQQTASVCCCRHRSASRADAKAEIWGSSAGGKILSTKCYPFIWKTIYPCISLHAKLVIMSGPCTECLRMHMGAPKPAPSGRDLAVCHSPETAFTSGW